MSPVDIAIITIKQAEFEAVLRRIDIMERISVGVRMYVIANVDVAGGRSYRVAVARCNSQGNAEAQALCTSIIHDLCPIFLLVVGIAGAVPSNDQSLGDVVVSTHVYDYRIAEATIGAKKYAQHGGPLNPRASSIATFLPALTDQLGDWNSESAIGMKKPPVPLDDDELFYGADVDHVKKYLAEANVCHRLPKVVDGAIVATDFLMKDPSIMMEWRESARDFIAIEMETAGVYVATHTADRAVPFLAIRGLSDVVGYKRDDRWTQYACHSAASFASALIRTGIISRIEPSRQMQTDGVGSDRPAGTVASQTEHGWEASADPAKRLQELRRRLIDAVCALPGMASSDTRNCIVEDLPLSIRNKVKGQPSLQAHVASIVDTCIRCNGGLESLSNVLTFWNREVTAMDAIRDLIAEIASSQSHINAVEA